MIPRRRAVSAAEATTYFDAIARNAEVEPFPDDVEIAIAQGIEQTNRAIADGHYQDRRDIEFVTLDPEGSRDLDQAMSIIHTDTGFRVWYAIADVGAFVIPGDVLDLVTRQRGMTLYLPDRRIPLHPESLSEGAASLLPDCDRPAVMWELDLDSSGAVTAVAVTRALVRSRGAFSYVGVQQQLERGEAAPVFQLLEVVGKLRQHIERQRGAINVSLPDQELERTDSGWELQYRVALPVEEYNAQLSLMVGMEAASMLVSHGVGLLRTMPAPDTTTVEWLRRVAAALELEWPNDVSYQEFVRTQASDLPATAAFVTQAARLLRGAGYEVITAQGVGAIQAAVAAPYAHVTAPLRRLGDRFNNEVLVALSRGEPAPDWTIQALPQLPEQLAGAGRAAAGVERAVVNTIEALLLERNVGSTLDAWVVNTDGEQSIVDVMIPDPAIMARATVPGAELGQRVLVRVDGADPARGVVQLSAAPPP